MADDAAKRVQRHRRGLRALGLRPVQIWAQDTRRPGFAEECRRQALLVRESETADAADDIWFEASDKSGWTA
jgi:hypothetical protein